MRKITFIALLLSSMLMYSQSLPLTYEDGTTTTNFVFNGVTSANIANPDVDMVNGSARVLEVQKPMGSQWFAGCGYQAAAGTPFIDMANGTSFTVKIWSSKMNVPFRFRLQADLDAVANTAYNNDFTITTSGEWIEYTIDFSGQVSGTEQYRELVIQPDYDPACEGSGCPDIAVSGTYYIDDIIQVPNDANADATLSDLQVDGMTVAGFSPANLMYDVEVPMGTMTVPTVTATATQGGSMINITDAMSIPGTTTVEVTAPNGTDMLTYSVSFAEAEPLPGPAPEPPARPMADVVSIYSNSYTNESPSGFLNFGSASATDVDLGGGNIALQGIFDTPGQGFQYEYMPGSGTFIDLSDLTMAHIDLYIDAPTPMDGTYDGELVRLQILNWNGGGFDPLWTDLLITTTGTDNWYSADIDLSTFNNPAAVASISQVQLVQIIYDGGVFPPVFIDNIYFHKDTTLSTEEVALNEIKVFPNPTTDNWIINSNQLVQEVQVYDMLGKLVVDMQAQDEVVTIDASALNSGLYFARISSEAGTQTLKLVKE